MDIIKTKYIVKNVTLLYIIVALVRLLPIVLAAFPDILSSMGLASINAAAVFISHLMLAVPLANLAKSLLGACHAFQALTVPLVRSLTISIVPLFAL
jgi:hypothetical protein